MANHALINYEERVKISENFVTVTATWGISPNYASGNFEFVASGTLMSSSSIAIVYPFIDGQLDSLGSLSLPTGTVGTVGTGAANSGVSLLASDNFGAGELYYNIKILVQGLATINAQDIPVNFALGASQGLFTILEAAGWTPDTF